MNRNYVDSGRKRQKEKTRDKILKSAKKLLGESGDFSLEDIARHTGLSRATVYRYYSNVEILASEAGLDLNIDSPDEVYSKVMHLPKPEQVLAIQDYYNNTVLENEPAFRKYLSAVLATDQVTEKRGARRKRALSLVLSDKVEGFRAEDTERLMNIATVLMGMEALVVTKDVCQLNNDESKELLNWGLRMIIKGMQSD